MAHMEMSAVVGINISGSQFVVSCNVCNQLKRTLSQLHYFSKLAEILQRKYFLSKMLGFQKKKKSTFLHLFMGKCQNWMKISNFLMGKFKMKCFILNWHFDISTFGSVEKSLKCRHFEMSEMSTFWKEALCFLIWHFQAKSLVLIENVKNIRILATFSSSKTFFFSYFNFSSHFRIKTNILTSHGIETAFFQTNGHMYSVISSPQPGLLSYKSGLSFGDFFWGQWVRGNETAVGAFHFSSLYIYVSIHYASYMII